MTALLVGPRSKKNLIHGMSISFDLLVSGFIERDIKHIVIDRSFKQSRKAIGAMSLRGIFQTLFILFHVYKSLNIVDNVYLTIGTSRLGFIKDALMIWPSWLFNKRIVLHLKGGGWYLFYTENRQWFRFLMEKTYNKADTIIVLGELLRDQFAFIPGCEKKIEVVPNGLPINLTNAEPKQITRGEKFKLLYLSNLIPSKGYLDVLRACHILFNERGLPIHCDFCGAFIKIVGEENSYSPEEAERAFFQRIEKYNLSSIVKYHGVVRDDQKIKLLKEANILILPTNYPWEGQPVSIIEALAFGNPVISTPYRGIPEEVIDGYNGYLIPFGDVDQIADKIEMLWNSPELYFRLSNNAITHYQEHFTQEMHLNRLIPIITRKAKNNPKGI